MLGKDDEFKNTIYIGEAEEVKRRLKQHIDDENYWSECVVVLTKDNYLNKAHVKYLENKFYNIAKEVDRYKVVNATVPTCPDINTYDESMLEEFMSYSRLLINTLGFKVFEPVVENENAKSAEKTTKENIEDVFYIKASRNANAAGKLVSDGFVVLKGSTIANETVNSFAQSLRKNRERLIEEKIVDENFKFVKDYIFTSPSLAAAIVMGRNANGRTEWKTESGRTIKSIEEQ
ncbi:MAG: GIY-YIG nuclease family protein [Acutalibacteraceae bacterium]